MMDLNGAQEGKERTAEERAAEERAVEELSEKLDSRWREQFKGGTHVGSYEPGSHGTIDFMGCTV